MNENNLSEAQLMTEVNPVYYKGNITHCDKDWYFDEIVLSYDKFYFIIDGECTIKINGEEYTATPGQLFLLPYNSTQSLYTGLDKTVTKYWFHCLLPCGGKDLSERLRLPHFINVDNVPYVEDLFKRILAAEKQYSLVKKLTQKADILNLLAYYIRSSKAVEPSIRHNDKVTYILSYIEQNLTSNITLEELSSLLHYHPSYFLRFFKAELGTTPMAYIRKQRIARARRLLLDGNITIQDLSIRTGFQSPHYFTRCFKKETGMTPTEYQRLAIEKHTARGIVYIKKPYRPSDDEAPECPASEENNTAK